MTAANRPIEETIAIVDYGMGNLRSVEKAIEHIEMPVVVTNDSAIIATAGAVILPGVGAFGDTMREMAAREITDVVRNRALEAQQGGRPFLGICLGMQVLVDDGEEDPGIDGLGLIPGSVPRLIRPGMKIPHMGWNALTFTQKNNPLFDGLPEAPYVYFVHSYQVQPKDSSVIAATADYAGPVVASLRQNNLFATQFHPEKSQEIGLKMLRNFGQLLGAGIA